MSIYETALADIFDRRADRGKLPVEEERYAIAAAKLGDEAATVKLMYSYAYTLREAVTWYMKASPTVPQAADVEDVRAQAVAGLLEAVAAFDPDKHERLAAIAHGYVTNAVSVAAQAATGFAVPERSLKRFFSILRKAEGNVYEAAALAPKYEMTSETFLAILSAVRNVSSYDGLVTAGGEDEEAPEVVATSLSQVYAAEEIVEDRLLVEAAFRAVDELETVVVSDYYGFSEYNTKSDAEIAADRGLSRPKVQRVRSSALGKMRNALGVA